MSCNLPGYPKKEQQTLNGVQYTVFIGGVDMQKVNNLMHRLSPRIALDLASSIIINSELVRQRHPIDDPKKVLIYKPEDVFEKYRNAMFVREPHFMIEGRMFDALLVIRRLPCQPPT